MIASLVADAQNSQGLHYKHPRDAINIKLPDNLECGNKIYIHGAVALSPTKFSINLKDGEKDSNTYFHFNPRFGEENVVVRNSHFNEAWGSEEKDGGSPFAPGEEFLISIAATVDGYEVEVNGTPFTVFRHRDEMPLCKVTHLTMAGDVVCYGVHVPLSSMPVPLTLRIPGEIHVGDMLFVKGEVPDGPDRFAVNLQSTGDDDADIMFHFNPRFADGQVICNSRCAEAWDTEEREGLPIGGGDKFNLCIAASNDAYHTYINDSSLVKFSHRIKMSSACNLHINGDISIFDVCIDCTPPKMPPHMGDDQVHESSDESSMAMVYCARSANHALKNPLQPGSVVVMSGTLDEEATRFLLNLQCGEDAESDVALHFNPRWDSDGGPIVVFNSQEGGTWGEEVRAPNEVSPGSKIEVEIACNEDGFCAALNGNVMLASFAHRMDFRRITHVVVDGCLCLERLIVV